jgi:hypothetical protein
MFFRSLHFFVEWCEYRENTFKHFKVKSEVFEYKYIQKNGLVLIVVSHSFLFFLFFFSGQCLTM